MSSNNKSTLSRRPGLFPLYQGWAHDLVHPGTDSPAFWDYVRTYMQPGPDALPPVKTFQDPNDVSRYKLALRLAPKVQWPAEMDLESRRGPEVKAETLPTTPREGTDVSD